jgi:hypothetical protein
VELDARGRRLRAALAAVLVRADAPELRLVHDWLDSWSGIGLIVVGMSHQGFTVSLGEHGAGRWIAVFFHGRGGHEPIAAAGTAQEATPWRAVQRAEWETLNKAGVAMGDEWTHAESGRECQRIVIVPFCGFDVQRRPMPNSRPADGAHTPRARARCPRAIASACSACAAASSMRPTITYVSPRDRATDPVPGSTSAGRATVTFPGTMNAWKDHGGPMHRERRRLVSLVCLGTFGVSYRRHSSLRVAPASPETPGAPATADQA